MKNIGTCDLCGLSITPPPVVQTFDGEEKHFCCQGCLRVYQVAFESGMLDQVVAWSQPRQPKLKDIHFKGGETVYFSLGGMYCAGCAVAAENVIRNHPGIQSVDVSFAAERGRIQYDPEQVNPEKILKDLDRLGYQAQYLTDVNEQRTEKHQERILLQLIVALAFGMQVMLLYFVQLYPLYAAGQFIDSEVRNVQYLVWLLTTPILIYGGNSFLQGAWRALRARTATMDTLVALGSLSAYGYSVYVTLTGKGEAYFDSVAMITTFIMFGRYIETLGSTQARKDIRKLLLMRPSRARILAGESKREVDTDALAAGDRIEIRSGERIPTDAQVLDGGATVDQSLLTGESVPIDVATGDAIYAGALVVEGALIAEVTRTSQETRLAQITRLVEQTLAAKPPIQRLADRAAAYFAVSVLMIAVLTGASYLMLDHTIERSVLTMVSILVIACPCALGLATPLAIVVAMGRATREGVLIRNILALEYAAQMDVVCFDKTGTITEGRLQFVSATPAPSWLRAEQDLICLAATVEQRSAHPIAKALVSACEGPTLPIEDFQSLRGFGASAIVGDGVASRVLVGSERFLDIDANEPLRHAALQHISQGETVVWVGQDGILAGFLSLRDEPQSSAHSSLLALRAMGLDTTLLSGDHPQTTEAIATGLGFTQFAGHLTPEEKSLRVRERQEAGEQVVMVGDGVNDAPALAQADLSIAMAGGTDVAGETSDVLLMRRDLNLIPWFLHLSRRTRRVIFENLGWAFAYNSITIPLAVLGLIKPVIAAITMATSSLLVIGNSLRLRH